MKDELLIKTKKRIKADIKTLRTRLKYIRADRRDLLSESKQCRRIIMDLKEELKDLE